MGIALININQTQQPNRKDDHLKKAVNEVLKRADQFIKKGDLAHAEGEINKAKEIDPHNIYAFALEERINSLKAELERLEQSKKNQNIVNLPEEQNTNSIKTKKEQNLSLITCEPKQSDSYDKKTTSNQNISTTNANSKQDRNIELETYRKAMLEAWFDGSLSESEKRQLSELKELFEISDEEHNKIEKSVRLECYKNAVINYLTSNPQKMPNAKSFIQLRKTFNIDEEEHQYIQNIIFSSMQPKRTNKILVIDDDVRLLQLIQTSLEDHGFEVIALSTSDEALALLRKLTPDLILCDINLETSTMGGFTFYEKIQQYKHLQEVPFIFLTGLSDEVLFRTGKELGVDDYIMKPISEKMLISALRGKLKRFEQLKKAIHS